MAKKNDVPVNDTTTDILTVKKIERLVFQLKQNGTTDKPVVKDSEGKEKVIYFEVENTEALSFDKFVKKSLQSFRSQFFAENKTVKDVNGNNVKQTMVYFVPSHYVNPVISVFFNGIDITPKGFSAKKIIASLNEDRDLFPLFVSDMFTNISSNTDERDILETIARLSVIDPSKITKDITAGELQRKGATLSTFARKAVRVEKTLALNGTKLQALNKAITSYRKDGTGLLATSYTLGY